MSVSTQSRSTVRFRAGAAQSHVDRLAVEAPLTLVLDGEVLVTTMRTPGSDTELVCGWLINESDVFQQGDIATIQEFAGRSSESDSESKDMEDIDTVLVTLAPGINGPRPKAFMTTSACGVCSSDILAAFAGPKADLAHENWTLNAIQCETMIEAMREHQKLFDKTGSLHAAALFTETGQVLFVREDVGRHNAVDKVVGKAYLEGNFPMTNHILTVSGRVSYEIVHKALTASVAAIVAVSGPTTLAVDLAKEHGLVLIGFTREGTFNIYSGAEKVIM